MNLMKDRSNVELGTFAVAVFGMWVSIWGVVLTCAPLFGTGVVLTLGALLVFAILSND